MYNLNLYYYIIPVILVDGESVAALEDIGEVQIIGDILLSVIVGMTL